MKADLLILIRTVITMEAKDSTWPSQVWPSILDIPFPQCY